MASPCVPSLSVVSKVKIFILLGAGGQLLRHAYLFLLFQECHHLAKFAAYLLDGLIAGGFAHRQELVAAGFVFLHPLLSEIAGLDFFEDLLHLGASLIVDDARAARIIAILGRVGHGIAHVAETAFIDEIDDELQFMQALEIGDLGGIASFYESLETGADQLGRSTAEYGLLAEQIA